MTAFQDFLAEAGRRDPQLLPQRGDGVVLVVEFVAQQEQFPLLGAEQEHQPHHDRQGGFVEHVLGHALEQQLPPLSWSAWSSDWIRTSTACGPDSQAGR